MKLQVHNRVAHRSRQLPRSFALQFCAFFSLNFTSRLSRHSHLPYLEPRIFLRGHCPAVSWVLLSLIQVMVRCNWQSSAERNPVLSLLIVSDPQSSHLWRTFPLSQSHSQKLHFQVFIVYEGSSMCPSSKIILFGAFWWSLEELSSLALGQIVSSPEHQCSC